MRRSWQEVLEAPSAPPHKIIEKEIKTEQKQVQQPDHQLIIPENAQTSHDYREVEAMRRTALLQKELIKNWRPPIGIPPSARCEIQFSVDKHGSVKEISIIKSSGIMMYDLSARHALFSMKMPQWTQQKTLTIIFTQ